MKPTFRSATLFFNDTQLDMALNKMSRCEELYVDFREEHRDGGSRLQLMVHPKQEVVMKGLEIRFEAAYPPDARCFCNGFASEFYSDFYQHNNKPFQKGWLAKGGTEHRLPIIPDGETWHSWFFGKIILNKKCVLFGSLNESTGFTQIGYDKTNSQVVIRKAINGLSLNHSFPMLELLVAYGADAKVTQRYFNHFSNNKNAVPLNGLVVHGSEEVNEILALKATTNFPADLVVLDVDYAQKIGDWLYSNDRYTEKIPYLFQKIRQADIKAGISIAPLLCSTDSDTYRTLSRAILKNEDGQPVTFDFQNTHCHVLDIFHNSVQEYLNAICFTLIQQWGVDWIQIRHPHLAYAAARKNKTSAQALNELLKLFRGNANQALLHFSEVPILPGLQYGDTVHMTATVLDNWQTQWPRLYRDQTVPAATQQLTTAIRRLEAGIPNPVLMNVSLSETSHWTAAQQFTLLFLNRILGTTTLLDSPIQHLNAELQNEWQAVDNWKNAHILSIQPLGNSIFNIQFSMNTKKFNSFVNLHTKKASLNQQGIAINLEAGETIVLALRKG